MKYARYEVNGRISYGIVEIRKVFEITTPHFENYDTTGTSFPLSEIKLLAATYPKKILLLG